MLNSYTQSPPGFNEPQIRNYFELLRFDVHDELIPDAYVKPLPENCANEDAPPELAEYGVAWCLDTIAVALRLPSALSSVEYNYPVISTG